MSEFGELSKEAKAYIPQIPERYARDYEKARPQIQELYKEAEYWHGSGRYQHRPDGTVTDVLSQLASDGGLVPKHDVFDQLKGPMDSISLAWQRPYAAVYAKMHLYELDYLGYEDMTQEYWWKVYWNKMVHTQTPDSIKRRLNGEVSSRPKRSLPARVRGVGKMFQHISDWNEKIRQGSGLPKYSFNAGKLRSDIPGNYPVLFGVKEGKVDPIETGRFIAINERRTNQQILWSDMTHIEVPYRNMDETERILGEHNVHVPVIPLELGEIYESQFSLEAHRNGNPFRAEKTP